MVGVVKFCKDIVSIPVISLLLLCKHFILKVKNGEMLLTVIMVYLDVTIYIYQVDLRCFYLHKYRGFKRSLDTQVTFKHICLELNQSGKKYILKLFSKVYFSPFSN